MAPETDPQPESAPETVERTDTPSRGALIAAFGGSITIRQRADGLPHEGHDPSLTELSELLEAAINGAWDVVANVTLSRTDR